MKLHRIVFIFTGLVAAFGPIVAKEEETSSASGVYRIAFDAQTHTKDKGRKFVPDLAAKGKLKKETIEIIDIPHIKYADFEYTKSATGIVTPRKTIVQWLQEAAPLHEVDADFSCGGLISPAPTGAGIPTAVTKVWRLNQFEQLFGDQVYVAKFRAFVAAGAPAAATRQGVDASLKELRTHIADAQLFVSAHRNLVRLGQEFMALPALDEKDPKKYLAGLENRQRLLEQIEQQQIIVAEFDQRYKSMPAADGVIKSALLGELLAPAIAAKKTDVQAAVKDLVGKIVAEDVSEEKTAWADVTDLEKLRKQVALVLLSDADATQLYDQLTEKIGEIKGHQGYDKESKPEKTVWETKSLLAEELEKLARQRVVENPAGTVLSFKRKVAEWFLEEKPKEECALKWVDEKSTDNFEIDTNAYISVKYNKSVLGSVSLGCASVFAISAALTYLDLKEEGKVESFGDFVKMLPSVLNPFQLPGEIGLGMRAATWAWVACMVLAVAAKHRDWRSVTKNVRPDYQPMVGTYAALNTTREFFDKNGSLLTAQEMQHKSFDGFDRPKDVYAKHYKDTFGSGRSSQNK